MADSYGTGDKGPQGGRQDGSQQDNNNYTYRYNYSFGSGSGRGTTPNRPPRPPKNSDNWGEWLGIAVLFMLPTGGITQIIAVVWAVRKILAMDARQRTRYRQEAQRAAHTAKEAAENLFQQADASARAGAQDFSRQAASYAKGAKEASFSGASSQSKREQRAAAQGRKP